MQSIIIVLASIGLIVAVVFAGQAHRQKAELQQAMAVKADRLAVLEREVKETEARLRAEVGARNQRISEDRALIERLQQKAVSCPPVRESVQPRPTLGQRQSQVVMELLAQGCSLYADWSFLQAQSRQGTITAIEKDEKDRQVSVCLGQGVWIHCWLDKDQDAASLKVAKPERLPDRVGPLAAR